MKKIYITVTLCLLSIAAFTQIQPFLGIYNLDSCNFETQCSFLKMDTSAHNVWQTGTPSKPFFNAAYTVPNVMVTDTLNPYSVNNHSWFDLVLDNMNNYFMDKLICFRHKFQTDTLVDGGYIEVSYDKGQTWLNIIDDVSNPIMYNYENLYSEADTLAGGINGFSGTSSDWIYTRIQLIWCMPVKWVIPDTLIMRFNFISDDVQTNKDGWMIDNILISWADLGSSVKDNDLNKLSISPNPLYDLATISFDNPLHEKMSLQLLNSFGEVVRCYSVTDNQVLIEKGNLGCGLYMIRLLNNQRLLGASKLIIQ